MNKPSEGAMRAFDAFAAQYDHYSDEWLDMEVQQFFCAGYAAALAERDARIKVLEGAMKAARGTLYYIAVQAKANHAGFNSVARMNAEQSMTAIDAALQQDEKERG